jgi:16S rRNA (cytidine1402-2'-O)-methyltransferase
VSEVMGSDRHVVVAREITKAFEEIISGSCEEVLARLAEKPIKGEIVFIISANTSNKELWDSDMIRSSLTDLIINNNLSVKDSVKNIMEESGLNKKDIYKHAIEIKNQK